MSQLFISRMPKMRAIPQLVSAPLNPIPIADHFRRMPEKQTGIWTVSNCARSFFFFYQHADHLPVRLRSIKLKYPDFLQLFDLLRFILYYFCASWILSCEFTLSKGKKKKLRGNVVFTTTAIRIYFASLTLMQITLHRADFGGDKNVLAFLSTIFILTIKIL